MSRETIEHTYEINAEAEKVWANVAKASGVHEWLPVITACHLEGEGVGAKRVCTTEQGDMNETILSVDHDRRIFRYAIDEQPLLPISKVVGTMKVAEEHGKTKLHWTLDFDIDDEDHVPAVRQAVGEMYQAGANGLETISQ